MNDQKRTRQLALFADELPDWKSLTREAQQSILEALSQILLQTLQQRPRDPIANSTSMTTENSHVS